MKNNFIIMYKYYLSDISKL